MQLRRQAAHVVQKFPGRHKLFKFLAPVQKIGYDKAAAIAKKAHKEGLTLEVSLHLPPQLSIFLEGLKAD
jgi:fumarate hydratase class II